MTSICCPQWISPDSPHLVIAWARGVQDRAQALNRRDAGPAPADLGVMERRAWCDGCDAADRFMQGAGRPRVVVTEAVG